MKRDLSVDMIRSGRVSAVVCLFLTIFLACVGLTMWPICIYAAPPFFFIACVCFVTGPYRKQKPKTMVGQIDMTGWF